VSILRLRIPVPEVYTTAISDTSVVNFTVDAMPGKIFTATLSRKSGSISLANRTETWEFIFPNKEKTLKPGMFANAAIRLGREELSFMVPASAVTTTLEKKFVIRLSNGVAEYVDVKTGFNQNDKLEIFGAINEGDIILSAATDEIKPGTKLVGKAVKKQ
jgi:RND family efflux transporter MFP subunit